MAAKTGNRDAEKWTPETVASELETILAHVKDSKEMFLTVALSKLGHYRDLFRYWEKKFADSDDEVFRLIKIIETEIEANLLIHAVNARNPTIHIFTLKNHHGWRDKTETEISGKDGRDLIPATQMSQDELTNAVARIIGKGK